MTVLLELRSDARRSLTSRLRRAEEDVQRLTRERDALLELRERSETEVHELRALLQIAELWLAKLCRPAISQRQGGLAADAAKAYAQVRARHEAHVKAMRERLSGQGAMPGSAVA